MSLKYVEYATITHELIRVTDEHVEVGLAAVARNALGALLDAQLPDIGTKVLAGERLGIVEGSKTAAEFYAPCAGRVVAVAEASCSCCDWLVRLAR